MPNAEFGILNEEYGIHADDSAQALGMAKNAFYK